MTGIWNNWTGLFFALSNHPNSRKGMYLTHYLTISMAGVVRKKILRNMKLTALFTFVFGFFAFGHGSAQQLTIQQENATLQQVFHAVEQQSDYHFFYADQDLENAHPVNVKVKNADLATVLKTCFAGQPFTYSVVATTVMVKYQPGKKQPKSASLVQKTDTTVHGTVMDELGHPMSGVSVTVDGGHSGSTTDEGGAFRIDVENLSKVLVFKYVGYETVRQPLQHRTQVQIELSAKPSSLEELVVVGYGTQKKENLTTAVSQITAKELDTRPLPNVVSALQGQLPGLNIQSNNGNPGETPDINIRGFNSLNGGGPLILIDGIVGDIDRINPSDIETVTVLKDAASSAIYGARGAFGVVLITTKKGKAGSMSVNYTNNFGATRPTSRTDYIADPYVFGKTVDAAIFGYNGTSYTGYDEDDWEKIKQVASGQLSPFEEKQADGSYKFFGHTDWYDELFREWQPSQNHNISISGGSEKLHGYLSGRYYKSVGIQNIVSAPLTKYNLKANLTFKVNPWLQISDDIQFNTSDQMEYGGYRNGWGGLWSNTTWYNLFPFYPDRIDGMPFDFSGGGAQGAVENGSNWKKFYSEQFINTLGAKLNPLKNLEINFNYSNKIYHIANSTRLNEFDILTGPTVELQHIGVNRLTESRNRSYYKALNIFGTYKRDFKDHHFKLMMGYNQEDYDSDNILAEQGGLLYDELANLNLGTEILRADGSGSLWAVKGYFGRFNYDYKNRYLLEVNARYDGSSRFPSESRWGMFPSVSAGWYVSREAFWEPIMDVVSNFKLRASYGKLGNQNVDLYTFSQILGLGQSSWLVDGTKLNYASVPAPLPSSVSWEKTKTIDFGVDLGFLNNKITASFDWYEKNTDGMYLPGEPLPAVFGAAEPKENIGGLRNRGFELALGYNDQFRLAGSPLHLSVSASLYNFKGVITKYPNPNGIMSSYWVGQELGQIWGYTIDGQFQSDEEAAAYQSQFDNPTKDLGQVYKYIINTVQNKEWKGLKAGDIKYVDLDGDGSIDKGDYTLEDHGDLRPIGNGMPKLPFGFTLSADWKGFDLYLAGAGVVHQDWYPTGDVFWGPYERPYLSFIRKDLIENAWTPAHPENTYPQIYRGYAALGARRSLGEVNDYYLMNVGYLRIKNFTLGYTLPDKFTKRLQIKKLRFYVSGENLLTWRFGDLTKYIDPEQAGSGINYNNPGSAVSRARLEDYPIGKTFSVGASITL